MGITLDGNDIETVTKVIRNHRQRQNMTSLGAQGLQLTQNMKNMLWQYEITGIWSQGDADYDSKESLVTNYQASGLPVWLDCTSWRKGSWVFGRVHDFQTIEDEGAVNVTQFQFFVTGVLPWGYTFIQDDGSGDFRVYDLNRAVQSRNINPILKKCSFSKTTTQVTYSFYCKNIGSGSGTVVLEMMVPDEVNNGNVASKVTISGSFGWASASGTVGTSGFSSSPGTKQRVTLSRFFVSGEVQIVNVTLNYVSSNTSFIDGSLDDTAP